MSASPPAGRAPCHQLLSSATCHWTRSPHAVSSLNIQRLRDDTRLLLFLLRFFLGLATLMTRHCVWLGLHVGSLHVGVFVPAAGLVLLLQSLGLLFRWFSFFFEWNYELDVFIFYVKSKLNCEGEGVKLVLSFISCTLKETNGNGKLPRTPMHAGTHSHARTRARALTHTHTHTPSHHTTRIITLLQEK